MKGAAATKSMKAQAGRASYVAAEKVFLILTIILNKSCHFLSFFNKTEFVIIQRKTSLFFNYVR